MKLFVITEPSKGLSNVTLLESISFFRRQFKVQPNLNSNLIHNIGLTILVSIHVEVTFESIYACEHISLKFNLFWGRRKHRFMFLEFMKLINSVLKSQCYSECSWFLVKNLSNFVSLSWKLHNQYCHKCILIIMINFGTIHLQSQNI